MVVYIFGSVITSVVSYSTPNMFSRRSLTVTAESWRQLTNGIPQVCSDMKSDSSVNAVRREAGPLENADLLCLICAFVPLGGSRLLLSSRVHVKILPVFLGVLDSKAMFCTLFRAMVNCLWDAEAYPTLFRESRRRFHKRFRYHSNDWSYEQLDRHLAYAIAGGADADLIYGLLCVQRTQQAGQENEAHEGGGPKGSCDSLSEINSAAWSHFGTPLYAACKRDDVIVSLLLSFGVCGHSVDGVQFVRRSGVRVTALYAAANDGRESTVRFLLRQKADPMETSKVFLLEEDLFEDRWFPTPLAGALRKHREFQTPLAAALQKHQAGVVKALLDCGVCPSRTCVECFDIHGRAKRLNGFEVAANHSWAGLDRALASCPSSCRCRCCCRVAHSDWRDLVRLTT